MHDITSDQPYVTFTVNGVDQRVGADVIVGCDGSFGPSRAAIPETVKQVWEKPIHTHGLAYSPTSLRRPMN